MSTVQVQQRLAARRAVDQLAAQPTLLMHLVRESTSSARNGIGTLPSTSTCAVWELTKLREQLKAEIRSYKNSSDRGSLLQLCDVTLLRELFPKESRKQEQQRKKGAAKFSSPNPNKSTVSSSSSQSSRTSSSLSSKSKSSSSYRSAQFEPIRKPELPASVPRLFDNTEEVDNRKHADLNRDTVIGGKKVFVTDALQVVPVPGSTTVEHPATVTESDTSSQQYSAHSMQIPNSAEETSPELAKLAKDLTTNLMSDPQFVSDFNSGTVDMSRALVEKIRNLMSNRKPATSSLIPSVPICGEKRDAAVQMSDRKIVGCDAATSPQPLSSSSLSDYSRPFDVLSQSQPSSSEPSLGQISASAIKERRVVNVRVDGSIVTQPKALDIELRVAEYAADTENPSILQSPEEMDQSRCIEQVSARSVPDNDDVSRMVWSPANRPISFIDTDLSSSAQDSESTREVSKTSSA